MKFRICLLSITCCLLSAVQIDAGQNSNAVISLDYVASGQGNQTDDGVMSGTVSGRGTTIVVEVFAKNVSTSLSAVEIIFKSSPVLTYVGAENPNTFVPVNLSNGVALTFSNPLIPSASGDVFLAKAEFTTLVDVSNSEFKIEIEKVKLVEDINNFDEITSSNEIVFNRASTTNTLNPFQIVWPMDGDINYDGHVNVADFLLLVDNFGKTGVVPTSRMAIENALAAGGSGGTVITIRDTVYVSGGVTDTIYVGQDVGVGLSRIGIRFGLRRNWDGSDPDGDGIELTVHFYDMDDDWSFAPEIVKVEVTLGKDNDRDDKPDVPLLLDRVVAVFSETDRKTTPYWRIIQERSYSKLRVRIPEEIYSHKLDITGSILTGDSQYGVVDVYVTTTSGTFSDRDDVVALWKPVVPSDE